MLKNKIFDSRKGVSGSVSKSENDHFGMSDGIFFFCGKKSWSQRFLGWNLLEITVMLQHFNIISGSQSKVEKTEFFSVFSTFHRDPEIIM